MSSLHSYGAYSAAEGDGLVARTGRWIRQRCRSIGGCERFGNIRMGSIWRRWEERGREGGKIYEQKQEEGWHLRTKGTDSEEGGVAAGFSVLDSLLLVDIE